MYAWLLGLWFRIVVCSGVWVGHAVCNILARVGYRSGSDFGSLSAGIVVHVKMSIYACTYISVVKCNLGGTV